MKFRIIVEKDGRKMTRHIRASDRSDAERQANIIAGAQPLSGAERAVLGAPRGSAWVGSGRVISVEPMGLRG